MSKQIESLAEPIGQMGNVWTGASIFDTHKICRKCKLQYPKHVLRCEDCKALLASKPRSRKNRIRKRNA